MFKKIAFFESTKYSKCIEVYLFNVKKNVDVLKTYR